MDKEEFSAMLAKARGDADIDIKKMCMAMNMWPTDFARIEKAKNNYSISRVFEYVRNVGKVVVLSKNNKDIKLHSEFGFVEWFSKQVDSIGRSRFAEMSGIHRNTIYGLSNRKTTAKIDMFLKIIETLGYTVKLE